MTIFVFFVIIVVLLAVYLGRPVYHGGRAPRSMPLNQVPASVTPSPVNTRNLSFLWGWGFVILIIGALFFIVPWIGKEHVKNISSVEAGKKIAEISSQLSQTGDFLSEETRGEIENDLKKIREMSENKEVSSEKIMFFVNAMVLRHQNALQKATGLEKIRQQAEKQGAKVDTEKRAKAEAIEREKKAVLVLTPSEKAGVKVIFHLPKETKYGDSFEFLEAVAVGSEGGISFGDYTEIKRFPLSTVPAGLIITIPKEAVKKNGNFELVFLSKLASDINSVKIKKKGGT